MSETEFEVYLDLLMRLLRLSPEQRDEISEELRDHLETRLKELLQAGNSRADATRIALEEFGDAAGLAHQFVTISQLNRKRWIMRFATFAIAGSFLATLLAFAFWPEQGRLNIMQQSRAQGDVAENTATSNSESPAVDSDDAPDSVESRNRLVERELNRLIEIDILEASLEDFIEILSFEAKVPFHVKQSGLNEVGVDKDDPVTLKFQSIRVSMALDLVLDELNLDYVVHDGIVIITSAEDVEYTQEIRIYDCSDLVDVNRNVISSLGKTKKAPSGDAMSMEMMEAMMKLDGEMMAGGEMKPQTKSKSQIDDLVGLIESTIQPDSWMTLGGYGSISNFQGILVVRQNPKVQLQIEKLLAEIRQTKTLQQSKAKSKSVEH
jgi:hypothetical protein